MKSATKRSGDSKGKKVMTVHGPIDPSDIGKTLIHEHLVLDVATWYAGDAHSEKWIANSPIGIEMLGRLRMDPFINKDNLVLNNVKMISEELGRSRTRRLSGRLAGLTTGRARPYSSISGYRPRPEREWSRWTSSKRRVCRLTASP